MCAYFALLCTIAIFCIGQHEPLTAATSAAFKEPARNLPAATSAGFHGVSSRNSYGYYWTDSDTNQGVQYDWIDITTTGQRVGDEFWYNPVLPANRLDDGTSGPFPIGFAFPYCDRNYDSVYIGTNGVISFSEPNLTIDGYFGQNGQEFCIPGFFASNSLSPCYFDLYLVPGINGGVYVWTNPTLDTFIVSYDSVRIFGSPTYLQFQVILSNTDSSITFQYLSVADNFTRLGVIGIQDSDGVVGLEYFHNRVFPSYLHENFPHAELAVKFRRDTIVEHNIGLWLPQQPLDNQAPADFPEYRLSPIVAINSGTAAESIVVVTYTVREETVLTPSYQWEQAISFALADHDSVILPQVLWQAEQRGKFYAQAEATVSGDEVADDDIVSLGSRIMVEDREFESYWAFSAPAIDGQVAPDEWVDAGVYDVSAFSLAEFFVGIVVDMSHGAAILSVKNDSAFAYFMLEVRSDSTGNALDRMDLIIDDDFDSSFAADSSEGRYRVIEGGANDSTFFQPSIPYSSDPAAGRPLSAYLTPNYFGAVGHNGTHVIVEMAIPLGNERESINRRSPGDRIGLAVDYFDWADSALSGSTWLREVQANWPFENGSFYAADRLGIIVLASRVVQCGDINASQSVNIADAIYLINYIFASGAEPLDGRNGDLDCSGRTNIADIVSLVNYIFAGGPQPCAGCK